jgi:hypothetical protein
MAGLIAKDVEKLLTQKAQAQGPKPVYHSQEDLKSLEIIN